MSIKVSIKQFNLRTIAESGQIFRMKMIDDATCELQQKDKYLLIKSLGNDMYELSCSKSEFDNFYYNYFDLKTNYDKYKKNIKKDDTFLLECIKYSKGLRILNQDPFEMLISFIISQRKSIPAIRTSIERLSKICGKKINTINGIKYTFPNANDICKNYNKLASCGLGYRLPYIIEASRKVAEKEINLDKFYKLNNVELMDELLQIKGVGKKVASCIMLFAYHRIDICPVDVWINRVIENKYNGSIPKSYEKYQGIIQQYWFYYAKDHKVIF